MNIWGINRDTDANSQAIGFDPNGNYVAVKRIKHTTGVYKDYIDAIDESYQLGWTPYRIVKRDWGFDNNPVHAYFKTHVYVLDNTGGYNISSTQLTQGGPLITYAPGAPIGGGSAIITGARGPPGPVGQKGSIGPPGALGPAGQTGARGPPGQKGTTGGVGPKGDIGPSGATGTTGPVGPVGPKGGKGQKGDKGTSITDAATKSWVVNMIERATSMESVFTAKLNKQTAVTGTGRVLKGWKTIKQDDRVAQVVDDEFTISQPSSVTAYLEISVRTKQSNVRFEMFSNTGAVARDSATVSINAGEVMSIALHHRITSNEKLTIRIMGTDLNLSVAPKSRVEVTLLRRWEPSELLVSGKPYPWGPGTYNIGNSIEKYQTIHITGQKGLSVITKTISPVGLLRDTVRGTTKTWMFDVETSLSLTFSGKGHKTLKIESEQHFKIISMYGERG